MHNLIRNMATTVIFLIIVPRIYTMAIWWYNLVGIQKQDGRHSQYENDYLMLIYPHIDMLLCFMVFKQCISDFTSRPVTYSKFSVAQTVDILSKSNKLHNLI